MVALRGERDDEQFSVMLRTLLLSQKTRDNNCQGENCGHYETGFPPGVAVPAIHVPNEGLEGGFVGVLHNERPPKLISTLPFSCGLVTAKGGIRESSL